MKIGILGGGQLGRMMALAGLHHGHTFRFFDSSPEAPAQECGELVVGSFSDNDALTTFAKGCDVVTYEFENVALSAAQACKKVAPLFPSEEALRVSQDRIREKSFFKDHGIATPAFVAVGSRKDLEEGVKNLGLPAVVKTTTMGYDGKGQRVLRSSNDLIEAWNALGKSPLILEQFISFDRELSQIAARDTNGKIVFYPLVENTHREGILRKTVAPAPSVPESLARQAQDYVTKILTGFNYVGVFTLELFQKGDTLLANEMAPRVHNSGHWTMDGAETSQFENHVRAVSGMPLGSTRVVAPTTMINLIGDLPAAEAALALPGVSFYSYGKSSRPGRKVGHINVTSPESLLALEHSGCLK